MDNMEWSFAAVEKFKSVVPEELHSAFTRAMSHLKDEVEQEQQRTTSSVINYLGIDSEVEDYLTIQRDVTHPRERET